MDAGQQRVVLLLTIASFFIEFFGGRYYRSLALVTDASFMAINITGQGAPKAREAIGAFPLRESGR